MHNPATFRSSKHMQQFSGESRGNVSAILAKRTDPNGLCQNALRQQLKWFEPKWLRVYILYIMSDAVGEILHYAFI